MLGVGAKKRGIFNFFIFSVFIKVQYILVPNIYIVAHGTMHRV